MNAEEFTKFIKEVKENSCIIQGALKTLERPEHSELSILIAIAHYVLTKLDQRADLQEGHINSISNSLSQISSSMDRIANELTTHYPNGVLDKLNKSAENLNACVNSISSSIYAMSTALDRHALNGEAAAIKLVNSIDELNKYLKDNKSK